MKKLLPSIIILLFAGFFQLAKAQNTSNKGKDFWVAYSGHIDGLTSRLTLFLSADQTTDYEIYIGNVLVQSSTTTGVKIAANTCLPVTINPNAIPVYIGTSDVRETDKAIHVLSTKPISLYTVISNNARTGGTMVLPTNTLGKEYYAYTYKNAGASAGYAEFTIVATVDNTNIEITPTANERNNAHLSGVTFTKTLNKGEIYQYQSANKEDLTGSYIKSIDGCRPIAVFSGNTWAAFCEIGSSVNNPGSGDNLYQQLFPINTWGKKFVTAPFYNTQHGNAEILKVIISENNTTLSINGNSTSNHSKGEVITFSSTTANVIFADQPISVAQYQTTQSCNLNNTNNNDPAYPGDPEITVLNPVEQTLSNITVFSDLKAVVGNLTNIDRYYLNVIIKSADASSFRLDGNPVSGFVSIDAEYSYITINVTGSQPQHRLTATGGFSAVAYGYGRVESYSYLAGANIQDFTFQPSSAATGQKITSGCIGEEIKISINLPYKATKLVWEIDGDAVYTESSPVETGSFFRNNIEYFTFVYYKSIIYNTAGDYSFKVTATKPTADNCGNSEELIAGFTIDNEPTALFDVATVNCQEDEIQFTDKSLSNSTARTISSWIWDFGDGTPFSTEQNPKHKYLTPGSFNVILTASTETKCGKTSAPVSITIKPKPDAKFTANQNSCIDTDISFVNQSTIDPTGNIVKWNWDMGDGTKLSKIDGTPFNYKYTAPGKYTVTLIAESDKGCISIPSPLDVNITTLPIADFNIPDVCLADAQAVFVNSSTDYDGTIPAGLTYLWDFGDATSGALNNSTERDGKHKYNAPGYYTVTLTLTNANGCKQTLEQPFTVNGSFPKADFETLNPNNLCSNQTFTLKNISTVDFGNITKVQWYIDGVKYGDDDLDPTPNKLYDFSYPQFTSPASLQLKVKMVVYSGGTCSNEIIHNVDLLASPVAKFDALDAICLNGGTVQFTATETGGLLGTYEYTGAGVSPSGLFNPIIAGVGKHDITYTFTASNGCTNSQTQSIEVYPVPTVDAGSDFYILAGGEKQISATASGNGLTYKWTPSIGLSADDVLSPIANPEQDTKYTLTVTSSQGCYMSDDVYVYVLQNVNAPNSFTPNGDGVNDVWNVKYLDTYPNANVEIYNRNGERIYFSKGYAVPFDGNYKNQPLPVGTYYYIINPNSGRKSITGNLTIIR
ncbi:MAG: PKD domain-containing protein [Acinetobacter sp.]|nr:MAG: PKD domain-containing protein [Acinetobacter sp.]